MQFIAKKLLWAQFFLLPFGVHAQSTYLEQGNKYAHWLSRLEIKWQKNPQLSLLGSHWIDRKTFVAITRLGDSLNQAGQLFFNSVEKELPLSIYRQNSEWYTGDFEILKSKHTGILGLYHHQAHALEIREKDFKLLVDPVLHMQYSKGRSENQALFFNSRGVQFRGVLGNKIGFNAYLTDNQERGPSYVRQRIDSFNAVPGAGFYKSFHQTGVDYFDARGSVYFNASKQIQLQFGYDKNFIGNGYRSLFLSDVGNSNLFLKLNTQVWKLHYTNLLMELVPQTQAINSGNKLLDRKYAVMRHLSVPLRPWLQLGVFESVIFGRKNHFDFTYMNPIMFLRVAEQQNGSADNALIGFDLKANMAQRMQIYGQFLLDEFFLKEIKAANGWWANKYGLQAGLKYIDLLGFQNLDLQTELNVVRPFTYSHFDAVSNYTHYNQPIAHPLGANFSEWIAILRYQPATKWILSYKNILWKQGLDPAGSNANFGADIFKMNTTRSAGDDGYKMYSGIPYNGIFSQMHVSYEWKENLFVEATGSIRRLTHPSGLTMAPNTTMVTVGIRWNALRREYDY